MLHCITEWKNKKGRSKVQAWSLHARKKTGEMLSWRPSFAPTDFQEALEQHPAARSLFERLSYSKKKRFVDRIEQAEGEAARRQRLEKAIEQLEQIQQIHQQPQ